MVIVQVRLSIRQLANAASNYCISDILTSSVSQTSSRSVTDGSLILLWFLVLSFTLGRIVFEMIAAYLQKYLQYILNWSNWLEGGAYLSTLIFLSLIIGERQYCFCPSKLTWEFGIAALLLSWLTFVLWLQNAHFIGIYITMMIKIIHGFIRSAALLGILLVCTFGLSFYLLFSQPLQEVRRCLQTPSSLPPEMLAKVVLLHIS